MTAPSLDINGTLIGPQAPPYIIAEVSGNHAGDLQTALRMIEAAAEAGVNAVKLQTYTADMITIDHPAPPFLLEGGLWQGRTLYDLYTEAATPLAWHKDLFACARDVGLTIFSSPFGAKAVDLLESLEAPAYKIASFEITDTSLLKCVRDTGKPVIISTGMATLGEIDQALEILDSSPVAALYCTSSYPAPMEDANLSTIPHMAQMLGIPVGLSDHTKGIAAPIAACALGANIIEKHFCLSDVEAVDSAFSITESELAQMTALCRQAFEARGTIKYGAKPSDQGSRDYRRSIYVVADIPAGEALTPENIRIIRPGFGLPPIAWDVVLGKAAKKDLKRGDPLSWDCV